MIYIMYSPGSSHYGQPVDGTEPVPTTIEDLVSVHAHHMRSRASVLPEGHGLRRSRSYVS